MAGGIQRVRARLRVPDRRRPAIARVAPVRAAGSVAAGSVTLGGEFSAIFSRQSHGGWQVIGHTDAVLWDIDRPNPALLTQGMWVRFRAA